MSRCMEHREFIPMDEKLAGGGGFAACGRDGGV